MTENPESLKICFELSRLLVLTPEKEMKKTVRQRRKRTRKIVPGGLFVRDELHAA